MDAGTGTKHRYRSRRKRRAKDEGIDGGHGLFHSGYLTFFNTVVLDRLRLSPLFTPIQTPQFQFHPRPTSQAALPLVEYFASRLGI